MTLLAQKGVITAPASGTTVITGLGFQPKAVFLWAVNATAEGFNATHVSMGFGFAVSSSARKSIFQAWRDAQTTVGANSGMNNMALSIKDYVDAFVVRVDLVSMDADGFTLSYPTFSSGLKIHYIAVGGTDLTNVFVGSMVTPTAATNSHVVTGVGFQPDSLMFLGAGIPSGATLPALSNDLSAFGIGAMSGPTEHGGASWFVKQGSNPATTQSYERTGYGIAMIRDGAVRADAKLVSFDADGFTLDFDVAEATAYQMPFLALKGAQVHVGNETQKTSTGTKAKTGLGFKPKALLVWGANKIAQTGLSTSSAKISIGGAATVGGKGSVWAQHVVSVSPTQVSQHHSESKVLVHASADNTIDAEADLASFDDDGFTLDWTTVNEATAREFIYWAVGPITPLPPSWHGRGMLL